MRSSFRSVSATLLSVAVLLSVHAVAAAEDDNIGHRRHFHRWGRPHETVTDATRFTTSRTGASLELPNEKDAFFFVVFGDRTGGPVTGVSVLADAVRDTNLLEPDLVMTVGDLVNGYNQKPLWMEQMREFKGIMDQLLCPWFPVAGNHDVYWRGPKEDRPKNEHDQNYELHFGPLWYAFEHKDCWFIALYSDEGNPETGEKNFRKAECQKMSDEQFDWLADTLQKAKDADHVFLFLHHPRWLKGGYGDDWDRVHDLLKSAGNVSAVFAGHIHQMRYDGPRDGIEYVTLATVGGGQNELVPSAGWLHQFHVVTVREEQIAMASIPVGEVMDVREITPQLKDDTVKLRHLKPAFSGPLKVRSDGSVDGMFEVKLSNPTARPVEVMALAHCADSRWFFTPDHKHQVLQPGDELQIGIYARRAGHSLDEAFRLPDLVLNMDYLAEGYRYTIPEVRVALPIDIELAAPAIPAEEHVAEFDGKDDYLAVDSQAIDVPDGPFTLECWFNADEYGKRTGLLTKTQSCEYGFFVSRGRPHFSVHLDGKYYTAEVSDFMLKRHHWHHIAGVFDGQEIRLYVDGVLIAATEASGKRTRTNLPLLVGADVKGDGSAMSHFDGKIDAVRLSTVARYTDEGPFTPQRRMRADEHTRLLLNMDGTVGMWCYDESSRGAHAKIHGQPEIVSANGQ